MSKVLSLNTNIVQIEANPNLFLGEIVDLQINYFEHKVQVVKVFKTRVIALDSSSVYLQPLVSIPAVSLCEVVVVNTQKPLQVNLSPTILGRKFDATGNDLDGLGDILEIDTDNFELKNKNIEYSKVRKMNQFELLENLGLLEQDNLVIIHIGEANSRREKLFQINSLTQISVQYQVGYLWVDWLIAFEQALVVAKYISNNLNFEVILILEGEADYQQALVNQNIFYSKLIPDSPISIQYPNLISKVEINIQSKVELWLI
jgi:hypothetical protein